MTEYFVLEVAPMDCSFTGPFGSQVEAHYWIDSHESDNDFEIMTRSQMEANIAKYGEAVVQTPQ